MVIERPIRSIGRFYRDLSPEDQRECQRMARNAHTIPKYKLDAFYLKMENKWRTASRLIQKTA